MASVMRFDQWQDSNGTPVLDGTGLAIPASALPAGSILQVVSAARTTDFTTTSGTYVDWTDVAATITPSATSSKVLVVANAPRSSTNATNGDMFTWLRVQRGSTDIYVESGHGDTNTGYWGPMQINFLDSPNTTSATTYKTQVKVNSGFTGTFRGGSITLMEVAG